MHGCSAFKAVTILPVMGMLPVLPACGSSTNNEDPVSSQDKGTGLLVIGDDRWELDVNSCSLGDDPDWYFDMNATNDDVIVTVTRRDTGGTRPSTELLVLTSQGGPIWRAEDALEIDRDGVASVNRGDRQSSVITFFGPTTGRDDDGTLEQDTATGTFEATCGETRFDRE